MMKGRILRKAASSMLLYSSVAQRQTAYQARTLLLNGRDSDDNVNEIGRASRIVAGEKIYDTRWIVSLVHGNASSIGVDDEEGRM